MGESIEAIKDLYEVNQYCGFKIENADFAIPVMEVQEVIKPIFVTPIPKAQDYIRGLINLRGQIVTCISLRKLFGKEEDFTRPYMNIIIKGKEGLFSLIVDDVTDIMEVSSENLESTPETVSENLKKYISCKHF